MFLMTLRLNFRQPSKKMGHECEYFAQNPVLIENSSFSQKVSFSSKTCPGHPACSFDDPRENFLPIFPNLSLGVRERWNSFYYPGNFSPQKDTLDKRIVFLKTLPEILNQNFHNSPLKTPEKLRKTFQGKNNCFFFKRFIWTFRMQIWQT